MARECFEDDEVAALLNEHFISIKVDREERPDLDQLYMSACQALTGQGGWPLSVFLTPEKKPFFAGTYIPKHSRFGISGMMELLPRLAQLWRQKRKQTLAAGEQLIQALAEQGREAGEAAQPGSAVLHEAYRRLHDSFDERYGGFGGAPKFPVPHRLTFLLRYWKRTGEVKALQMVTATLRSMARGGICDQIGYGFHRYSTDEAWLAPHFEKMLYDQALLAIAYLEANQTTGEQEFATAARAIFEYLLRDLRTPEGAFCTAEDADTAGEEGLFYLWTPAEIAAVLGKEQGAIVADYFGVTTDGNLESGRSILHRPHDDEQFAAEKGISPAALRKLIEAAGKKLLLARNSRERPFRDDKILTAWNGLAVAALARGGAVLGVPLYTEAAEAAVSFIRDKMIAADGRLQRRYRGGEAALPAYLDDYAFLIRGLLELYRTSFNSAHLEGALSLNESMLELFQSDSGALQFTGIDQDSGLPVLADAADGALPSGNAVAALNLLQLGRLTGREELSERGEAIIRAFSGELQRSPEAYAGMLAAHDFALGPVAELTIAGETDSAEAGAMADLVRRQFHPNLLLLLHPAGSGKKEGKAAAPPVEQAVPPREKVTASLCRERRCLPPVSTAAALAALLKEEKL